MLLPVEALRRFAADPTCRTEKALLAGGRSMSALEIQRHYCRFVGAHLHSPTMPDWADEVYARWCSLLERLENAPESVAPTLDAPMKLAVFKNHAKRRSFDWRQINDWNMAVEPLVQVLARAGRGPEHLTADLIRDRHGPLAGEVEGLKWLLDMKGLSWERVGAFLDLRAELQEIDTRWSQLGPKGIFGRIEATCPAALDHTVPGVDHIEDAMVLPPADTRAAVRGAHVKELANKEQGNFVCSWEHIVDREQHRVLNMADDPFSTAARWETAAEGDEWDELLELGMADAMARRQYEQLRRLQGSRRRHAEAGDMLRLPF